MEKRSDQHTVAVVKKIYRLERDQKVDLDHKLRSLCAIQKNLQLAVHRLRCQAEEEVRVKSNVWRHLADASEQLRADLEPATASTRYHPDWFFA
jgi:hypothetical protein